MYIMTNRLTLKVPEKLQLYGLYIYYVVHICDFGMLRVNILHDCLFDVKKNIVNVLDILACYIHFVLHN